jgi:D-xylose reductase
MASPTIKLNSGHEMPQVGFGLWKVANETAADTVYEAIKAGYRLLTAHATMATRRSAVRVSPAPSRTAS